MYQKLQKVIQQIQEKDSEQINKNYEELEKTIPQKKYEEDLRV